MSNELRQLAIQLATEAGELAMRRRAEGVEVADRKSSPTDVVTAVDREVEALLRERIATLRPRDAFCGEEGEDTAGESGLTWIIDPIDGTVNFLYGIPWWAVSVAVVEGDPDPATYQPLAGAVAVPGIGEMFSATHGGGAFLNEQPITTGPDVDLSEALVGTGFSYQKDKREWQAQVAARMIGSVRDLRRTGTSALDLCSVGLARTNAYFESGLWPWDHAASQLVVTEAGGWVGGLNGRPVSNDLVIGCHASLQGPFCELLEAAGAGETFRA